MPASTEEAPNVEHPHLDEPTPTADKTRFLRVRRWLGRFSPIGLIFALAFYSWSMSPSLLPRPWYLQAVASGVSAAIGYGLGALALWLLHKCGLTRQWSPRWQRAGWIAIGIVALIVIPTFLVLGSWWQDISRELVGIEPGSSWDYPSVFAVGAVVFLLCLLIGRGLRRLVHLLDRFIDRFLPAPMAVATTTGRGWVNQNVAASLEYLAGGDSAIASMQYSFLASPLAFLADRKTPKLAGRALFEAVYARWSKLSPEVRPKLLVFGESLGSYGAQDAFSGAQDIIARTDGALFVGTPNFTEQWQRITESRDPGSREILPIVYGGENVRFASSPADLDAPGLGEWDSPRIVYWQHASDPIVWWSPSLLLNKPDWLDEPRGEDIDKGMTWVPFVSFWQFTLDMVFAAEVPYGHGHAYGPEAVYFWNQILGIDNQELSDRIFAELDN